MFGRMRSLQTNLGMVERERETDEQHVYERVMSMLWCVLKSCNSLCQRTKCEQVKDVLKVDDFSGIRSCGKVVNHKFRLLAKDIVGVGSEGIDIKDMRTQFALPPPMFTIRAKDT